MTRIILIFCTLAVTAWSGWWWIGSTAQQTALTAWVDDRQKAGWVADYQDLSVKGFPNRFDTKVTDLNLADPRSGWAWKTPELQILMLSYQPNHIIAVLPSEQIISTPDERITVASGDIRASVKFDADTALALNATTAEMKAVKLISNAGWTSEMKQAKFATRQTTGRDNAHDIFFQADDLKPAEQTLAPELREQRPLARVQAVPWLIVILLLAAVAWLGWRAFFYQEEGDPVGSAMLA